MALSDVQDSDLEDTPHQDLPTSFGETAVPNGELVNAFMQHELGPGLPPHAGKFPSYWERKPFNINGQDISCICAPAWDPIVHIRLFTGLNSTTPYYKSHIRGLNKLRASVTTWNFPLAGDRTDFLDDYRGIAREALLQKPDWIDPDIPEIIITHSTGGLMLSELLQQEDTAEQITKNFTGALMMATFYTARFTRSSFLKLAYEFHGRINRNCRNGETLGDRVFEQFKKRDGEPGIRSSVIEPFHKQIRYMVSEGTRFMGRARQENFPEATRSFPIFMLLGDRDYIADPKAAREMAELMEAEVHEMEGIWHNPIMESKDAWRTLVKVIGEWVEAYEPRSTPENIMDGLRGINSRAFEF